MFEGFLRNSRILVVDRDARSRKLLRAVLTASADGMVEFAEAAGSQAALKILTTFSPDLIIAERTGDSPDGLELLRRVRGGFKDISRFTPYILLTEETGTHHLNEARDAGVTRCLEKPVSISGLYQEIAAVFRSSRPFIEGRIYFGPDRRQRDTHYSGDDQRRENAIFVSPPMPLDPPVLAAANPAA